MDKIELTKEEVTTVINILSEIPFKMSANLIQFFNHKLQEPKKVEEIPGKGE